ncbi:MAG: porin [Alphaproteobacteria bacterium]
MSAAMVHPRTLLTTASIAALLAAPAAAADGLNLELAGFYRLFFVAGAQDTDPGEAGAGFRNHGIGRGSEIFFLADTTLPNGISVGVNIQLEGETNPDQIDESYVFFEGMFGKVILGSEDPATDAMLFGAPVPLPGHGVNSPQQFHVAAGTNLVGTSLTFVNMSFDSDKVTWFTPRWQGFQLGGSYTPDNTEELGAALRPDITPLQVSEVVEVGGNWIGRIGAFDVGVHAGYGHGEREVGGPGLGDREQWGFGGQLGWRGLVVGASYRYDDLGAAGLERRDWNAGASYRWRAWTLAAAYAHGEVEMAGTDDTLDHYEIGLRYLLGPGLELAGGIQRVEFDSALPSGRNQALLGLIGTQISF